MDSGDCTNCGNTTEATTLLQQFIKQKWKETLFLKCEDFSSLFLRALG